jgi:hypothetical protein
MSLLYQRSYFYYTQITKNFKRNTLSDKTAMFLGYSELLNALDSGSATKLTICNKQVNRQAFEDTVLLPQRGDSLDGFVNEFNGMLEGKISGSSASVEQERFLTVSVHKKNVDEARTFFSRVPLYSHSFLSICPISCLIFPYMICLLYFGANTI